MILEKKHILFRYQTRVCFVCVRHWQNTYTNSAILKPAHIREKKFEHSCRHTCISCHMSISVISMYFLWICLEKVVGKSLVGSCAPFIYFFHITNALILTLWKHFNLQWISTNLLFLEKNTREISRCSMWQLLQVHTWA